jgi:ribosomal-protein-alanine N-acetyltransferase
MTATIPLSFSLETNRFALRFPSEADIPRVFAATRYAGFNEGMVWDPPEEVGELFASLARNRDAWEHGRGYAFSIYPQEGTQLLGRISIRKMPEPALWDVGFWTHPDQQGQGVMSEVLGIVLSFGFETLKAARIQACHALWNKASERVLQKNGFQFVAYLPQGFQKRGEWVEEHLLAISRSDWLKRKGSALSE